MKRTALLVTATLVVLSLAVGTANATQIVGADFNSPTYADGVLNTQAGWTNTSALGTNNLSVANSATNGNVQMTNSGNDERLLFAGIAGNTGSSFFMSADITVTAASTTGDYFFNLGDGGTSNFNLRTWIKSSGAGFVMAIVTDSNASPTFGSTVLSFGTTYHMLAELDTAIGATNDTSQLFINPADPFGVGDTAYVAGTNTAGVDAATIAGVYLRQGGATTAPIVLIDNISVDIPTPVPEPATLVLFGLGLLGCAGAARYRRKR